MKIDGCLVKLPSLNLSGNWSKMSYGMTKLEYPKTPRHSQGHLLQYGSQIQSCHGSGYHQWGFDVLSFQKGRKVGLKSFLLSNTRACLLLWHWLCEVSTSAENCKDHGTQPPLTCCFAAFKAPHYITTTTLQNSPGLRASRK